MTRKSKRLRGGSPASNHVMKFTSNCGTVQPVVIPQPNDSVTMPIHLKGGSPSSNHVMQYASNCGNIEAVNMTPPNDSVTMPIHLIGGSPSSNHVMRHVNLNLNSNDHSLSRPTSVSLPIEIMRGGKLNLPAHFFNMNNDLNNLYDNSGSHAYGNHLAQSHGTLFSDSTGPNLAPYPDSTGYQTGGKKRLRKSRKLNKHKKNRKSKKN